MLMFDVCYWCVFFFVFVVYYLFCQLDDVFFFLVFIIGVVGFGCVVIGDYLDVFGRVLLVYLYVYWYDVGDGVVGR